jgi:hypothetical protein
MKVREGQHGCRLWDACTTINTNLAGEEAAVMAKYEVKVEFCMM